MRYVLEFESADEMQGALAVLSGKAGSEVPEGLSLSNETGQTIAVVARPGEDGGVLMQIHQRNFLETVPRGTPGVIALGPGQTMELT